MATKRTTVKLVRASASPYMRLYNYGKTRTGKSTFAYTAREVGPIAVLDFGRSLNTALYGEQFQPIIDDEMAFHITHPDQVGLVIQELMPEGRDFPEGKNLMEKMGIHCIVLDELDNAVNMYMRQRMEEVIAIKPERDINKPALDDWGVVRHAMLNMMSFFLKLPVHVIITSWEVIDKEDEFSTTKTIYPSLPGKLASEIPGECDLVYATKDVIRRGDETEVVYAIRTKPTMVINAGIRGRDRADRFPEIMHNPTFAQFYSIWKG